MELHVHVSSVLFESDCPTFPGFNSPPGDPIKYVLRLFLPSPSPVPFIPQFSVLVMGFMCIDSNLLWGSTLPNLLPSNVGFLGFIWCAIFTGTLFDCVSYSFCFAVLFTLQVSSHFVVSFLSVFLLLSVFLCFLVSVFFTFLIVGSIFSENSFYNFLEFPKKINSFFLKSP